MAGRALVRAARRARAEDLDHSLVFCSIVGACRSAVQVDVIDVAGVQARRGERALHGELGSRAFRVRRRHVIGVGALADSQQANGGLFPGFLEQREARALADRDAVAPGIEGAARCARGELEGAKAIERGEAERVRAAHHRRVAYPRRDHARRVAEHLGSR